MDIIALAREIGKEIQKDERFLRAHVAMQAANEDEQLQGLIGQYNIKRDLLENELREQNRDDDKVKVYQQELNGLYVSIMKNEKMAAYNEARGDFDVLIRRVNAIIEQSANGEDPETADYIESCAGNCSACSGCQ